MSDTETLDELRARLRQGYRSFPDIQTYKEVRALVALADRVTAELDAVRRNNAEAWRLHNVVCPLAAFEGGIEP